MPGAPHETMVVLLREHPEWLRERSRLAARREEARDEGRDAAADLDRDFVGGLGLRLLQGLIGCPYGCEQMPSLYAEPRAQRRAESVDRP